MDPRKKPERLSEFLQDEEDAEYIDWMTECDFEDEDNLGMDEEWKRALRDLEELGFND